MPLSIDQLRSDGLILLESISGSRAYGLDTPESDTDIRGVFCLPQRALYGLDYTPQIANASNDIVFYELGRFVELLLKSNPTVLELLAMPPDTLIHRAPVMNLLSPEMVLSRKCQATFAGYARAQIGKARGLNKKIMNQMDERRKGILEFCWVVHGQGSVPVLDWLGKRGWRQEDCALANIPHMHDVYALFHGGENARATYGFKGIAQKPTSNNISLSSVPKAMEPVAAMAFNQDGYVRYCKDYKAYWDWVGKRNEVRYKNTVAHGKNYDAKNMMHTFRLLAMAREIGAEGKLQIRRPDRDFLLRIRQGEFEYDDLVREAETQLAVMDQIYAEGPLPEAPDAARLKATLIEMRTAIYQ
ncbi:MAG: nucleotidyltransferase domain-containing protein [Bacteroidota bacterium]